MVGISADKPEIQRKFVEKFELKFPMVPNPEKDIIDAYGSRSVLGIVAQRSTFLVDPEGRIAFVWPKVTLEGHAQDVVETIERLRKERA